MESPIWVCAFINLGQTILSDASMISPSSTSLEISMIKKNFRKNIKLLKHIIN